MTTATTEVRDRIGAFLTERNYSCLPDGDDFVGWYSPHSHTTPMVGVFLDAGRVAVELPGGDSPEAEMPADAPDLLDRLGETLDRLGV